MMEGGKEGAVKCVGPSPRILACKEKATIVLFTLMYWRALRVYSELCLHSTNWSQFLQAE